MENIINTFSANQKRLLGLKPQENEYLSSDLLSKWLVKRFTKTRNNIPIGILDILKDEHGTALCVAVASSYQRQGYGTELARKAIEWLDKNPQLLPVEWNCLEDNIVSNKLAHKVGFTRRKDMDYDTELGHFNCWRKE